MTDAAVVAEVTRRIRDLRALIEDRVEQIEAYLVPTRVETDEVIASMRMEREALLDLTATWVMEQGDPGGHPSNGAGGS